MNHAYSSVVESGGSGDPEWAGGAAESAAAGAPDENTGIRFGGARTIPSVTATGTEIENGLAKNETMGSASSTLKPDASRSEERRVGKEC